MDVKIEESWKQELSDEWSKDYFVRLTNFVRNEYATKQIFPPGRQIFAAFNATPFNEVKVVILGQDPYHDVGQANGLCFSVNDGIQFPPSLRNIFQEIHNDVGSPIPQSGDLTRWAKQGVLLLNATLTVEAHKAASHQRQGWEQFTDEVISHLSNHRQNLVFILWGSYAISKRSLIDPDSNDPVETPVRSGYPTSIAGATASIVSQVVANYPVEVDRLTQDEKMEIMDILNRKGVFLLKGSVSHVAQTLHSSEASIYRYLGKLNNK